MSEKREEPKEPKTQKKTKKWNARKHKNSKNEKMLIKKKISRSAQKTTFANDIRKLKKFRKKLNWRGCLKKSENQKDTKPKKREKMPIKSVIQKSQKNANKA